VEWPGLWGNYRRLDKFASGNEARRRPDRVLVVDAPEEVQVSRVAARSGLSEAEVRNIMAAQASRVERRAAADDVIQNGGTLDALREQVRALHARYVKISSSAAT
jgi:dephospho-CoA kinase